MLEKCTSTAGHSSLYPRVYFAKDVNDKHEKLLSNSQKEANGTEVTMMILQLSNVSTTAKYSTRSCSLHTAHCIFLSSIYRQTQKK